MSNIIVDKLGYISYFTFFLNYLHLGVWKKQPLQVYGQIIYVL